MGGGSPGIEIVDASKDRLARFAISLLSLSSNVSSAGMMAVSPKRDRTLVFSPGDNRLAVVANAQESVSGSFPLQGPSESFFVWTDNVTAFAAVPSTSIAGEAPGAVKRLDISAGQITATIPIPGAHTVVPSPDGTVILVFSDNSDSVTLLRPSLIGTAGQSSTQVPCSSTPVAACTITGTFDRPTGAVFNSSGTTAYVLNCGQRCGGTNAGACLTFTSCTTVSLLDMTQTPPVPGNSIAVPAATVALLQGNSLYVAGTPVSAPDNDCSGVSTAATTCGRLTVVDVAAMTAATPVAITDGFPNRMQMGSNGQLFIGARGCTNVNISGGEVRGCLSIVNTTAGVAQAGVIAPQDNGDVTGIEPIPNRNVVYVCEGGRLRIYDTTTDSLEKLTTAPVIAGQAVDVKMVDF
ncbi:MAG TPA: hypothetical protein VGU90_14595 [Terriglobales bacterium]|nr:hypothetical protein [Terriglobales bacterium]